MPLPGDELSFALGKETELSACFAHEKAVGVRGFSFVISCILYLKQNHTSSFLPGFAWLVNTVKV